MIFFLIHGVLLCVSLSGGTFGEDDASALYTFVVMENYLHALQNENWKIAFCVSSSVHWSLTSSCLIFGEYTL